MSYPPLPPPSSNRTASNGGGAAASQQSARTMTNPSLNTVAPPSQDMPPLIERSPRLPVPAYGNSNNNNTNQMSSAQRYLQARNANNTLFDSADYFSASPANRQPSPFQSGTQNAFEQVQQEAQRLQGQVRRQTSLSFEMYNEVNADDVDDVSSDEGGDRQTPRPQHSMRRSSMEEFFVEENEHETVKHAILEKPRLKRWDSGDFYSSPSDYRKMLATQAKDVLRQALDHAEDAHQPRRHRRSSLSLGESMNEDQVQ